MYINIVMKIHIAKSFYKFVFKFVVIFTLIYRLCNGEITELLKEIFQH